MLTVQLITSETELARLAPEWDALCATLVPRLPFLTPRWNLLYWKHLRRCSMVARDLLCSFALRAPGGELIAVAPMMITHRPGLTWPNARQLRFFGADPNITEMNGLVCRPEHYDEAYEALFTVLRQRRGDWDWMHLSGVPVDQVGAAWLRRHVVPGTEMARQNYCVELAGDWTGFLASRPRNLRKSLRRSYEALERDGHAFAFRVITDPALVQPALDEVYALHRARAEATEFSVQHKNMFALPLHVRFLDDYVAGMAESGEILVFQMVIADQVVATRIGFRLGEDLYLYLSGYRPDWSRYGVMTILLAEVLQWCFAAGFRRVNLSFGRDLSKVRWKPREYGYVSGLLPSPTLRGRLGFLAYNAVRSWRRRKAVAAPAFAVEPGAVTDDAGEAATVRAGGG